MGDEKLRPKIIVPLTCTSLFLFGCIPRLGTMEDWETPNCTVETMGREEDLMIPQMTEVQDSFRTNMFSLKFSPVGTVGYVLDVENVTRYEIEFDWQRSLIVDQQGWTHPLIYPGVRLGFKPGTGFDEMGKSGGEQAALPILIAPFAKRRIILMSRSLYENEFLFKPCNEVKYVRPEPSKATGELAEQLILAFRFREETLRYRFMVTFKARKSTANKLKTPTEASPAAMP